MRSFKKIILMAAALIIAEAFFSFCLEPVTYTYYLDRDLEKIKSSGKEPDIVLVGDSRIYRTFVPEILDERLGEGGHLTVNTGTGSQTIQSSYFYLKDLLERYSAEYVVVELSYDCFLKKEQASALGNWMIFDRIRSPENKISYMVQSMKPSEWPYALKSYRYRSYFPDIFSNIRMKLNADTRAGVDVREDEHYADRGFVWTKAIYEDGGMGLPPSEPVQWNDDKIDPTSFEWLDKIRELCSRENVLLILVTGPVSLATIYAVENYEDSYECFADYAEQYGLPYFELNLLKGRRQLLPDSLMRDSGHVCGTGAEVVSGIFCDILNAWLKGEDTSEWFYRSVAEMKRDIGEVVACDFHTEAIENSSDRIMIAQSAQEEGQEAEYEFWICPDLEDGKWVLLQAYSNQSTCLIPGEYFLKDVSLRVNARLSGSEKLWEAYMERVREAGA